MRELYSRPEEITHRRNEYERQMRHSMVMYVSYKKEVSSNEGIVKLLQRNDLNIDFHIYPLTKICLIFWLYPQNMPLFGKYVYKELNIIMLFNAICI